MSQNTANIPSAAIARTEILKDGAAVIYGADATGGVVNFITRDNFTGLEVGGQYKLIDGSDGDYGLNIIGGIGEGDVNFMWSAEWEHRSRLETDGDVLESRGVGAQGLGAQGGVRKPVGQPGGGGGRLVGIQCLKAHGHVVTVPGHAPVA